MKRTTAKMTIQKNPKTEMPHKASATFSKKVKRMLGLDLDGWNTAMVVFLALAASAAIAVGVSQFIIIKLQKASEIEAKQEFERYKLETDEKIAEANARTKEAELALEKLRTPRTLSPEAQARIVVKIMPFSGQEYAFSLTPSSDALGFLEMLEVVLKEAAWVKVAPLGNITTGDGRAAVSLFKAPGVRIQVSPATNLHDAAARALASALVEEGIEAEPAASTDLSTRPTAIQIVIGLKPL